MMNLIIKENQRNNQRMTVRDDRGQILYFIEGGWGRKDDIITLQAFKDKLFLQAKQIKLSPFPIFELTSGEEKLGMVRKHPGLFGIRDSYFTVHPQKWIITGDFEDLYFTTHHNNHLIMECEKIHKSSYAYLKLTVENEEDAPLSSLLSVLLDHYVRKKQEEEKMETFDEDAYDLGFLNHVHCSLIYPLKNQHQTK